MDVDWGRVLGAFFGFLLSIPAVFISLTIRSVKLAKLAKLVKLVKLDKLVKDLFSISSNRFIDLGCGIFRVKRRSFPPKCLVLRD